MTPEEIARRNAARTSAGELGEVVARAKPTVYVDSKGAASVGAQPTGTAMTVRKPSQALVTKPSQALATTTQPIPSEVRSTAKPMPGRPGPTITVDSKGVASTLEQRTGQVAAQRMATDRAARISAMQSGGIDALNQTIAQQTGTNPATGRTVGAAPASAPAAAPAAPATPAASGQADVSRAFRAGQATGRAVSATRNALPQSNSGKALGISAALTPIIGGAQQDSTERYAYRFGVDEPTGDGSFGDIAKFVALRAGGAATDLASFGVGLADLPIRAWNWGNENFGSGQNTVRPFSELLFRDAARDSGFKEYGTDSEAAKSELAKERAAGQAPFQGYMEGFAGTDAGKAMDAGASKLADVIGTGEQPTTAQQQPAQQPVAQQPAAQQQPAGQDPNKVLGTFNGRQITESQARELAGRNVVATPQPAAGEPRAAVHASRGDDGQRQLLAMLNQARGDRQGVQEGANARLKDLYSKFNDLMARGKRRSAAVVGDLIGRELGVIQGTAQSQMIDPRRPGVNPADDQRTQALTEGVQLDNRAKRLAQQSLEAYLADPTSEAGQQALARYQAIAGGGKQQNQEYVYERLLTPEGGESIVAINKANPGDARVVQPQQTPQQLIAEAQAAIAAGAPRDAVIAELKAKGINL